MNFDSWFGSKESGLMQGTMKRTIAIGMNECGRH
jgi:hypothetical protein